MGNASSHLHQPAIQVLEQLAGPQAVPLDDKLWQTVLSFTTPASRFDPAEVETAIKPHLETLGEEGCADRVQARCQPWAQPPAAACLRLGHRFGTTPARPYFHPPP